MISNRANTKVKHVSWLVIATVIAVAQFGCASRLKIAVSVYTGPLVEPPESRISASVGLARAMRDAALREGGRQYGRADQGLPAFLVQRLTDTKHAGARRRGLLDFNFAGPPNADYVFVESPGPNGSAHTSITSRVYVNKNAANAQLFMSIAEYYQWLDIEGLYMDYLDQGEPRQPGDPLTLPDALKARKRLFSALTAFADASAAIGQYVGVPEAAKIFYHDSDAFAASATLDETARILRDQIDSVVRWYNNPNGRSGEVTDISALMASQAPSTVLTAGAVFSPLRRWGIEGTFSERYWKNINHVSASGHGDVKVMLIKDEIGNWHLKEAVIDPSKIINAISAASVTAVKIAACALGAPVPMGQAASGGATKTPADAPAADKIRINRVLQELLLEVMSSPDPGKDRLTKAIDSAIGKL